jgi:hypothetical protein
MPGGGSKPGERRGGRKHGTPNKLSGDVRAMIVAALDEVGGPAYLVEQARSNPTAFLTQLGKVLPLQVNATVKRNIREYSTEELLAIIAREEGADDDVLEGDPGSDTHVCH